MLLLKSLLFLAALAPALADVVDFKSCAPEAECTIHEVRIQPCPQAANHLACRIRRLAPAVMSFDYTPHFDSEKLNATLTCVKSDLSELPLVSLDPDACKYTSCPAKSGTQGTYTLEVPIESKFPLGPYTIKWSLWAANRAEKCCFTTEIKLVR